ncbi:hypothetical protein NHP21005_10240 [Helicobacter sp. NHP21005]|nr:hypothetical protein NHP21005_10240 [Helicobacter sp. NHP21005]
MSNVPKNTQKSAETSIYSLKSNLKVTQKEHENIKNTPNSETLTPLDPPTTTTTPKSRLI